VGRADGRRRRRADRRGPPPRRAGVRGGRLVVRQPAGRDHDRHEGLVAFAPAVRARGDRRAVLGGGPAQARTLAHAAPRGRATSAATPGLRSRRSRRTTP
jgi:hypothetical protein